MPLVNNPTILYEVSSKSLTSKVQQTKSLLSNPLKRLFWAKILRGLFYFQKTEKQKLLSYTCEENQTQ
jgi:hypothetical protein